jgi:hypothetical protein
MRGLLQAEALKDWMGRHMNNLIWLVGAVVIFLFVLGYLGLR